MIEIGVLNIAAGLGLVAVAIGISFFNGFGLEKSLIVGIIRTIIQLSILALALEFIFRLNAWLTIPILILMGLIAAYTARGRYEKPFPKTIPILWVSITIGSFFALGYTTILSLSDPMAITPRYLIPLGGMVIGNILNGVSLAGERYRSELEANRDRIEMMLAMGATSSRAGHEAMKKSITAAMIPMINSLMVIGLIQIPGIMVGLVLSEQNPILAAGYQLLIMFMLLSGKMIAVTLLLRLVTKQYFTTDHQLRRELL